MEYITLNNHNKIPMVGYGTFKMKDEKILFEGIQTAYETGYRLFDTAFVYKNEPMIGRILEELKIRQDIVLATKVFPCDFGKERTKVSIDRSLRDLKTDFLDILYLHWPGDDMVESYQVLEDYYRQGVIKNIAVSNFTPKHLELISAHSDVKPQLNQIELHPLLVQENFVQSLIEDEIYPVAWSPLARGKDRLLKNDFLLKLGEKYQKTVAQIVLRWNLDRGVLVIPKSNHPSRIRENFDLFDFQLTEEEMKEINSLNEDYRTGSNPYDEEFLKANRYSDRWKTI